MTTTLQTLGVFVLCATLVALAFFVLFSNPRATVNRRFSLAALAIAGWIISISSALSAIDFHQTVVLGRLGFAFASAIPFTLLWMFDAFGADQSRWPMRVTIPGAACAVFVLLSLSPWIVAGATTSTVKAHFIYGPAHRFFGLYFLLSFVFALYTLWKTIRSASGLRKLQLRYLLLGILLGGIGAITTNLIIPLLWHTSTYSALGPYFSLLVVSCSAHAIIRYRLMDIRVIIRKGVVYVCTLVALTATFLLCAELVKQLTGFEKDSVSIPSALVMALALGIFFQPLKGWIQTSFNRYVYRETYDYQRIIREASRDLSAMLDLEHLLDYLVGVVTTTFKTETVTVYLRHPSGRTFEPKVSTEHAESSQPTSRAPVPLSSSLVEFLQSRPKTLVREEATRDTQDLFLSRAAQVLQDLGGELAVPLISDQLLVGFITIGPKRSGDPYFSDDISLLETLVSQAAVATQNAQLYRQVVLVNEYVDNILSTMQSGVIAVNALGDVSLFNNAAERLTSLQADIIRGQSYDLLPTALAAPLREALHARNSRSEFEVSLRPDEDTAVPLVCSTAILKRRDGAVDGALIVFSDLTRLKVLEKENSRAERLASFGALASGVAHEIKNPLVAIRTFAELLPERFAEEDFREDFSRVVISEIARIDDLVGRLRGIAASTPRQVGTIDIRVPIQDTLLLLRAQLEQTRTVVSCNFQDEAPLVAVPESQLKQLFLNLLLNSIEAMGTDGTISIQLFRRHLHASQWVVVEVADTGPGIPQSVRNSIFNPFFTTKPRGSGLGLAICRGIADAHKGTIRAENRLDRSGTLMVIEFPATSDAPVLTEESAIHG